MCEHKKRFNIVKNGRLLKYSWWSPPFHEFQARYNNDFKPDFFVSGDIKSPLKYARLELVDYQLHCFLSTNFIAWNCNDMLISYPRLVALKRFVILIPKHQNWSNRYTLGIQISYIFNMIWTNGRHTMEYLMSYIQKPIINHQSCLLLQYKDCRIRAFCVMLNRFNLICNSNLKMICQNGLWWNVNSLKDVQENKIK